MSDRPNVLLITTDQQRFDTIHAAGNPHIFTPHLDWLSYQGIQFTRCYSDCPACVPARATIMTGRYGIRNGYVGNTAAIHPLADHATLPAILTRSGYQTRAVGKMHFHPFRAHYGFEHMELINDYYRYMSRHPERGAACPHGLGQNMSAPGINNVPEEHSLTHWVADRSVDFLETRDKTRPFFLWTGFTDPHPPFDPCENYWNLYRDVEPPQPARGDWSETPESVPQAFMVPTYIGGNVHTYSPKMVSSMRKAYYACITQIDYNLGVLFARLRELGMLTNTWIIFTTDHGEMLGDHHMSSKSVHFEGSAHIPMLIRPPDGYLDGKYLGTTCNEIVSLADILPTLVSITGAPVPEELDIDGFSLLESVDGTHRREVFFGESEYCHLAMDERFKYHFTHYGGEELLFDISADPYETRNLAPLPEHTETLKRMRSLLADKLGRQGHPAAKNGRIESVREPLSRRDIHKKLWPGFHSHLYPTDLMH